MKRSILSLITFLFTLLSFAQMSDSQVVEYVKLEYSKGTSQQKIGANLLQKGVTETQLQRIKKQIEDKNQTKNKNQIESNNQSTDMNDLMFESPMRENINDILIPDSTPEDSISVDENKRKIYGHDIFNKKYLSFAPNVNIPTPANYQLGPGDEVVIEIWGASEASYRETISPDGLISIDHLGLISLNGMTVEQANQYLMNKFASSYSGIDPSDGTSNIKLTLGQIRTIQINVLGEVRIPGTYSLSSLSTVFHALYLAGGINDIGSLRTIYLIRDGKIIESTDIYDLLFNGIKTNTRLFDGDVVMIPPYTSLVDITGLVKRPMYYEILDKETLSDLIKYAGGFAGGAYTNQINLVRKTGKYDQIFTVTDLEINSFNLVDGDSINVEGGLNEYENRVEITGQIFRPGFYEISKGTTTIKDIISKAGNLKEDAYLDRVIITRQKDDLTLETLSLNLSQILSGEAEDILLKKNDVIQIASKSIGENLGDLEIYGEVVNPGFYSFAENTTVRDLIIKAGGLLNTASTAKIDISRRIIDPTNMIGTSTIAKTFTFSIENGLIEDGKDYFALHPYDQVYIRKSPGYEVQRNVSIKGEILFPGIYTMEMKEQRVSDLVKQAGGTTKYSFLDGAQLTRVMSEEQRIRQKQSIEMIKRGGDTKDSMSIKSLEMDTIYRIALDLKKALKNPKSTFDIVLKAGDNLFIPEFDNTVRINGAVMYPNTVIFQEGISLNKYIEQAGGYQDLADKNKVYIVYMNGVTAKARGSGKDLIKPGCEIIVPSKERKQKMSVREIISISSGVVSMASVLALLINSFK